MDCLFCKIVNGDLPANVVFEDTDIMVFHDIRPQAPTHLLIIPKRHIATLNETAEQDAYLLGKMILHAKKQAAAVDIDRTGYRLIFNVNRQGGQEVYHIHLHVLGGRQLTWPPG